MLTGHRGLPDALLFTRLDELGRGDPIYIQTLSRTIGYRVTALRVVKPTDTRFYKVVPGKDLVTLMTCTPYGVNTERLVIAAERANIPEEIPRSCRQQGRRASRHGNRDSAAAAGRPGMDPDPKRLRHCPPPPWHYDGSPVPKTGPFPRLLDRGPPNLGSLPGLSNSRKQQRNQLGP